MEKMNCDIIRDLIPSYVDEICSEATRKCVDEHMEDCEQCRQVLSLCRHCALSGKKLEQHGLDGMKKIKKTLKLQNLACYLSLGLIVFMGIQIFFVNRVFTLYSYSPFPYIACILACVFTSMGYRGRKNPVIKDWILGAVSLILSLYLIFLFFYTARELAAGAEMLFGRKLMYCGPFLERQLIAVFALQLAFLLYNLFCILRQDRRCNWLLCLNMMGMNLTLEYDIFLKLMDSKETLVKAVSLATSQTVIIGVLGIAACILIAVLSKTKGASHAALDSSKTGEKTT